MKWHLALAQMSKLERLKERQKKIQWALRRVLQQKNRMGLQKELLKLMEQQMMERQKEPVRRWQIVLASYTAVGFHQCCWCCHRHHSKRRPVRSSPIASNKSQASMNIQSCRRRLR